MDPSIRVPSLAEVKYLLSYVQKLREESGFIQAGRQPTGLLALLRLRVDWVALVSLEHILEKTPCQAQEHTQCFLQPAAACGWLPPNASGILCWPFLRLIDAVVKYAHLAMTS